MNYNRERILNDLIREREREENHREFEGYLLQNKLGYISDKDLMKYMLGEKELGCVIKDPRNEIILN
jgi:hypothetical protein